MGLCEADDDECRKKSKAAPSDEQKVQLKDFDDDEDKEILDSIKFAENKMGAKMGTPKALPKEHPYAPVKYDVEDVQLKDWDQDEDKEILESIKFAENKLGHNMGTPKALPKEHAYAPVKYDVEELSQKDYKYVHKTIDAIEKDKGGEAGDCELEDHECIQRSMKGVKKPEDDAKVMTK